MITKEQIELTASQFAHGCEEYTGFIAGAKWALEQCPYSKENIVDFGKYLIEIYACNGEMVVDIEDVKKCMKKWEEQK